MFRTARGWSWLLGIMSVVLPSASYTWQTHRFSQWASVQDGYVCSMPLVSAILLAALLAGALSVAALAVGVAGFRKLPTPRPKMRLAELVLVGLPAIVLALGMAAGSISEL